MFNTKISDLLEKAMDGSAKQHTVISNNIANVNTPGFKKSQVSFQDELGQALAPTKQLKRTNPKHFPAADEGSDAPPFTVTRITSTSLRNDGNNVDIDIEQVTLAENNLYFNSLAQLLSSQLALLRHSISEGRR